MNLRRFTKATCLEFVAGSHRWDETFAPIRFADGQPYTPTTLPLLPDIEAERAAAAGAAGAHRILSWDMAPGDCLVFHSRTLHCAPPNESSTHRRRALSTRWCGGQARYAAPAGCVGVGYPNFEVPLVDGGGMTCDAFPVVWPRDHAGRPPYHAEVDYEQTVRGGCTNPLLPASMAAAYDTVRTAQAAKYSLSAEGGGGGGGGGGDGGSMH